jgi:hypothetical protein
MTVIEQHSARFTFSIPPSKSLPLLKTSKVFTIIPCPISITPSTSSNFEALFNATLAKYTKQTGNDLRNHPLASRIDSCDSPDSILDIFQEQARAFKEFRKVVSNCSSGSHLSSTCCMPSQPTQSLEAVLVSHDSATCSFRQVTMVLTSCPATSRNRPHCT